MPTSIYSHQTKVQWNINLPEKSVFDHMQVYTVFVAEKVYLRVTFNDRVKCWIYTESGTNE